MSALRHELAAECGSTGIECFDAWAHELLETGYLHNHARMWFARYGFSLSNCLGRWERVSSSVIFWTETQHPTLSWRWVAGLRPRGKTYLARPDNIERFTEGRFSPS